MEAHNGISLTIKRNKFELIVLRWINPEPVIQSEVSQKEKNKYCILMNILETGNIVQMNLFAK